MSMPNTRSQKHKRANGEGVDPQKEALVEEAANHIASQKEALVEEAEELHQAAMGNLKVEHEALLAAEKQKSDAKDAQLLEMQRRFDEISQARQAPPPSDNNSSSSMDVDGGARGRAPGAPPSRAPGAPPSTSSMRSVGGRTVASGSMAAEHMFAAFGEQCNVDGADSDEGKTDEWEGLAGKASKPVTAELVNQMKAANAILTVNRTYERKCVNVEQTEFFLAGVHRDGQGEASAWLFEGYYDELNAWFVITKERTRSKMRLLKVKGKYENCALKATSKEIAVALRKENGVDTKKAKNKKSGHCGTPKM